MKFQDSQNSVAWRPWFIAAAFAAAFAMPVSGADQHADVDHQAHRPSTSAPAERSLADQLRELQAKIAQLETALQHKQMGMASGSSSGMQPMGGMKQGTGDSMPMRGMMGSGSQPMGQTSSMPGGGGGMSGMSHGTTGMMSMMGKPPSDAMSGMAMPTALPGFPGASHLYHIGSTGFFLDHDEHITLSIEQQSALNAIKEKALLANANAQRKIDAAEQELWELTASDQPDAAKIEAKVQEIEKMRADPRLSFIRAVGEAAKVLTDQQRQSLLGQLPQHNHNSAATPAASRGKK